MMIQILVILYGFCAALLALYTLGQGVLLIQHLRYRDHTPHTPSVTAWPAVTVQLPVYNERHVVTRLIDAVAALDYPPDKLHIQILDDSTDATPAFIARQIARYPHLNISHIRRRKRTGYKAGALAYGLSESDSPFVAIFDADFVPPPDFLKQTVPYLLHDGNLGVVQTRWGHLNAESNWLTRAQVLAVDVHFLVEQHGRNRAGWPLPFNGTGGVWRRACIDDAGGWSDDTLTEDLDLSFRAQVRGWKSLFLPDVVVPGELPPQLAAYRQQQARWAKGSGQCLRKLFGAVWCAPLSLMQRLMATQHLFQYVPHPLMLLLLLLTPPLLLAEALHSLPLAPLGLIGLVPPLMYMASQRDNPHARRNLLAFPALLLVGTGMIWNNSQAFISGLFEKGGEFRRTPKFVSGWQQSDYALKDSTRLIELALMLYALWGAWLAYQTEPGVMPYLLLYAASFATVAGRDVQERRRLSDAPAQARGR
jgi:cellulose synthase/poly-beta-1,6-N-acetylglucosamine synthase-like glycosyltransferase